ncbi:class I SAM-dependent methyltransferase [Ectopseudomonas khazarica]|uniref:class I SAM-dependent methyltransferase n=1 Tax=Ectopseudomonas khazarica TaxID=2502979 RepID=UPI00106EA273|nr:class I SAM-dependent methyltransferase [Pseudomonas khazarica]
MEQGRMPGADKFDAPRAEEYARQSRIALAGYDACHELGACVLATCLEQTAQPRVLVAGVGGGAQEIITLVGLLPACRFVAVDPSAPMLALAREQLSARGLLGCCELLPGTVDELPAAARFDAATLIGVLHHVPGDRAKRQLLTSIATRLEPGAPLVLAGNHQAYAEQPFLLKVWAQRWRQQGATPEEVKVKLGRILQGADPPRSEAQVQQLLDDSGFGPAQRFFSSLFWGAWVTSRRAG